MSNDDLDSNNPAKSKRSASSEITDAVLKSLKPRSGKGTTKWLTDITQEALEEPSAGSPSAQGSEPASPPAAATDMVTMVEKLFDLFTGYSFDFNKSVGSKDLNVDIERPTFRKAGDPRFGHRAEAAFTGRLIMRQWSLMIRGQSDRIEAAVIPSDQILAYNADPSVFSPYFAIELTQDVVPVWKLTGKPVSLEDLRTLAKQLLVSLMRFAKGELADGDQFFWTGNLDATAARSPRAGDTPSPGAPAGDRPPSFYATGDALFSGFSSGAAPANPELLSAPPSQPSADFKKSEPPLESAAKTLSVPFALGLLEEAVAKELGKLAKAGAKAFESQDLAEAEKNLKQTARVKEFSGRVQQLISYWQSLTGDR